MTPRGSFLRNLTPCLLGVICSFFNEFSLELPSDASIFVDYASKKGVLAGLPADRLFHLDGRYKNILVLAVTELNTKTDMNALIKIFKDYFK